MNKMISIAPVFMNATIRFFRHPIVKEVSAFWAITTFVLGTIFFSQVATALVLIVREAR